VPGRILAIGGSSLGTAFDELVLDLADGPCDDAAAALFEGTELVEILARETGACAYRVGPEGEETLDARFL
jgi:hypothetical protein